LILECIPRSDLIKESPGVLATRTMSVDESLLTSAFEQEFVNKIHAANRVFIKKSFVCIVVIFLK
jgi:hypothetical protein